MSIKVNSKLRIVISVIIYTLILFCLLIAAKDAFQPGLLWLIRKHCWINYFVTMIQHSTPYQGIAKSINCVTSNINASDSIIKLIGLSGTAIQIISDLHASKYPGLEMRTIFYWHYPGYTGLYVLHVCLTLLGHYAIDMKLEQCKVFCYIGLLISFTCSIWILIHSSVLSKKGIQKFVDPYIEKQIKHFAKLTKKMPSFSVKELYCLLYHIPYSGLESSTATIELNRRFEELIRNNEKVWRALLGNYSTQEHTQQVTAGSRFLQLVINEKSTMLSVYFVCGLLLWLHNSVPYNFSTANRWKSISQFIADIHIGLYSNLASDKKKKVSDHYEIAYGYRSEYCQQVDIYLSTIALNLLYLENIMWQPMSDETLCRTAMRLKNGIHINRFRPSYSEYQKQECLTYAMMIYHAIAFSAFDDVILPSRENMTGVIEYINEMIQW